MHGDLVPLPGERAAPWTEMMLTFLVVAAAMAAAGACILATLTLAEKLSDTPHCQNCHSWMALRSEWTRHVSNDAAASLGYADCIMALQSGLWQDAAKLLFAHGADRPSVYTNALVSAPLRLRLAFFDCKACGHQASRLSTQDKTDAVWTTRLEHVEAYRAKPSAHATRASRTRRATHTVTVIFRATVSAISSVRLESKVVVALVYMALIPLLALALGYLNARARTRLKHEIPSAPTPARPMRPR
jgi:hypothetical protein